MAARHLLRALAIALAAMAGGCANLPAPLPTDALSASSRECSQLARQADAVIGEAGTRDAEAVPIAGFPGLRADRFLASFRTEMASPVVANDRVHAWLARLARLDAAARAAEIGNLEADHRGKLNADVEAALARCREAAQAVALEPGIRIALARAIRVPPSYSDARRALGLYPLTSIGVAAGAQRFLAGEAGWFAMPPAALPRLGTRALYTVDGAPQSVASPPRDALGVPDPSPELAQRLAAVNAPAFAIDVAGPDDRPGVPFHDADGPTVDGARPTLYWRLAWMPFAGAVRLQVVYTLWFAARPLTGPLDPLGGRLDGIVWRVTLDDDGRPLVHDSIHACGCYQMFFPVPPVHRIAMAEDRDLRESAWVPRPAPQLQAGGRLVVDIASGSHYVRGLETDGAMTLTRVSLALVPEDALRHLPTPRGTRSLYGPDGLVAGSERLERTFLWPMGIVEPGAMRQWGHHATAFVGTRHFDDPDLLDRAFSR